MRKKLVLNVVYAMITLFTTKDKNRMSNMIRQAIVIRCQSTLVYYVCSQYLTHTNTHTCANAHTLYEVLSQVTMHQLQPSPGASSLWQMTCTVSEVSVYREAIQV